MFDFSRDKAFASLVPIPAVDWQRLAGGRTNNVWRAGEVVIKHYLSEQASSLFPNDINAEILCLSYFPDLAIAPPLLGFGANWLVLPYLRGRSWQRDARPVARILALLHNAKPPQRLRQLSGGSCALAVQTRSLLAEAGLPVDLPHCPEFAPPQLVAIHGDSVAGNIMVTPDGLRLIDWQCPALGDPIEDLAMFLSPAMQFIYRGAPLSAEETTDFLQAYPDQQVVRRYLALLPLLRLRMIAHCHIRARRDEIYAAAAKVEADMLALAVS